MIELPLYKVLKDPTRQEILNLIGEKGKISYTDLLTYLNVSTGKLNYHLKILAPFLLKSNDGYSLSDTGENAYSILARFHDTRNVVDRTYRSLSWMLIALSLVFLLIPIIYVEIAAIAVLFVGIFFFYNSGTTVMKTMEFLAVLSVSLVAGSYGSLIQLTANLKDGLSLGILSPLLTIVYSIALFSTLLTWALTTSKRWILSISVMAPISIFLFAAFALNLYFITSGSSALGTTIPIPAMFLLVTALSVEIRRFDTNQTSVKA
jgi:DNA-binding transcriptional ArsR family regulator